MVISNWSIWRKTFPLMFTLPREKILHFAIMNSSLNSFFFTSEKVNRHKWINCYNTVLHIQVFGSSLAEVTLKLEKICCSVLASPEVVVISLFSTFCMPEFKTEVVISNLKINFLNMHLSTTHTHTLAHKYIYIL